MLKFLADCGIVAEHWFNIPLAGPTSLQSVVDGKIFWHQSFEGIFVHIAFSIERRYVQFSLPHGLSTKIDSSRRTQKCENPWEKISSSLRQAYLNAPSFPRKGEDNPLCLCNMQCCAQMCSRAFSHPHLKVVPNRAQ